MEVEVRGSILPNPIIFGKQNHIVANRIATWRPLIGPLGHQLDTTWMPLVHGPYQLDAKYLPCGSLRLCHATTSADCTSCHVNFVHATYHPYGGATWNPFLPNFTCFAENSERISFTSGVHLRRNERFWKALVELYTAASFRSQFECFNFDRSWRSS